MGKNNTQTIGYPRIGKNREMKTALEGYWSGLIDERNVMETFREIETGAWKSQLEAGVALIGVGDASLYDHVLDWAVRFGLVPARFRHLEGLERYFAMARGLPGIPALELTKWFGTNYHYLVPEVGPEPFHGEDFSDFLERLQDARRLLGERGVPIVPGPITLLGLSRLDTSFDAALGHLLPKYRRLLAAIRSLDFAEVQLHEPALVLGGQDDLISHYQNAYNDLADVGVSLNLVTYFDDLGKHYPWVVNLPVDVISMDFTAGDNLSLIKAHGWPQHKTLAAGVVDGRNIWRIRPREVIALIDELRGLAPLRMSISSSLQFVPYHLEPETHLAAPLRGVLAFAEEKLSELRLLGSYLAGEEVDADWQAANSAWQAFKDFAPDDPVVSKKMRDLTPSDFTRSLPYQTRRAYQLRLPPLPTTTIGSFPQTKAVRSLRAKFKRGEIGLQAYQAGIDAWIAYAIGVQEGLGLDVLVHGEFERSDMVEYFAEKMEGFAFTRSGWVQSYGNRYVRPPIIHADIVRRDSITVREFKVAQAFTEKPVKGMLTGPVTMLNWSYARTDVSRREIAFQLALALRDEIADLEAAGARVIQVDEPALREGLPLKPERWDEYLSWAIDAFRLATGEARPETQVHTHMCYAEFGDILEAINRMDADVISIENARSGDQTLRDLAQFEYPREIGPGVYDVHSPVVPAVAQIRGKLLVFLQHLDAGRIWVNPDCGLKTRDWEEVILALKNIVASVRQLRENIQEQEYEYELTSTGKY
ncbi:MAG TPA: 5-methyltetrahydropteroyltriglutamate--homocysteine S-methyltransferase [Anaerolineales bacterium]